MHKPLLGYRLAACCQLLDSHTVMAHIMKCRFLMVFNCFNKFYPVRLMVSNHDVTLPNGWLKVQTFERTCTTGTPSPTVGLFCSETAWNGTCFEWSTSSWIPLKIQGVQFGDPIGVVLTGGCSICLNRCTNGRKTIVVGQSFKRSKCRDTKSSQKTAQHKQSPFLQWAAPVLGLKLCLRMTAPQWWLGDL